MEILLQEQTSIIRISYLIYKSTPLHEEPALNHMAVISISTNLLRLLCLIYSMDLKLHLSYLYSHLHHLHGHHHLLLLCLVPLYFSLKKKTVIKIT